MSDGTRTPRRTEERVVVLAPSAHDGPITADLLATEGFDAALVCDVPELCRSVGEGAAVVLVAQEALSPAAALQVADLLARQEPWSDLPLIVFTGRGRALSPAVATLAAAGNVTLLERPIEKVTLLSAVRAGLRARRRQYAARTVLADLARTSEELRQVDRRRAEFLAMLSHELRNPLAPIRNSVYLLERTAPGAEQGAHLTEVIRRQAQHLTSLVDDLLDVTRISAGKIELHRVLLDLREVVRKATDDMSSVFAKAGVTLRATSGSAGPVWINADPTRLAQIVGNLLQNAVKFTPAGGQVVATVAARQEVAELRVVDDGAGMDPAFLPHVFEPFAQADRSLARAKGGLGLGLALVKALVEQHGGSVEAVSEGLGRGAEFVVRLPLAGGPAQAEPEPPAAEAAAPRVVVLVEDNADGAQTLADILELNGHRVRIAHDGRSGVALAREVRPDVVLCDIGLPDIDGYEVARALRQVPALRATRLVALSGYAQPEDRRRAREAGFDAHLAKPPDVERLLAALAPARPDPAP